MRQKRIELAQLVDLPDQRRGQVNRFQRADRCRKRIARALQHRGSQRGELDLSIQAIGHFEGGHQAVVVDQVAASTAIESAATFDAEDLARDSSRLGRDGYGHGSAAGDRSRP